MGICLLIFFVVFMIIGVPISVCLGAADLLALALASDSPLVIVVTKMFNACDSFPLMAIPFFILAGNIMGEGKLSKRLIDFCMEIVGGFTGGMGMVAVLGSMFFAALSGSGPATVAAIGNIVIPAMEEDNYDKRYATALTCTAGALGPVIPPSILFVVYGVCANTSIGALLLSGVIPGLLIGLLLMAVTYFVAKIKGYGTKREMSFGKLAGSFKRAFPVILMPLFVLGGIYSGIVTATESALIAVVYSLFLCCFVYRSLEIKALGKIFVDSALTTGMVMLLVATATTLSWIMTVNLIPAAISQAIIQLTGNKIIILLLINLLLLFLGCVLNQASAILIVTPLFLPIVQSFGMSSIQFGCMLVTNICLGMVTPPVGTNLYVSCAISGLKIEDFIKEVMFLLIPCMAVVLMLTFIPALSEFLPAVFGLM